MIQRIILNFFFVLICVGSDAQPSIVTVLPDSTTVLFDRNFQEVRLDSFRNNPSFNYRLDPEYETNILKKMWLVIRNKMDEAFSRGVTNLLERLLYYGLILGAITGLIWFFIKRSGDGVFHRKSERRNIGIKEVSEANTLAEIESHLSQSIRNKDFRLATRLYFLRCLRQMDDADIIEWKSGKTNLEYLHEINQKNLKNDFADLSYIYDYVWYGEFDIENEAAFGRIQERFQSYDNVINKETL